MNLFDRFARVAKSNLNELANKLEDPEKIMDQAIEEMQVSSVGPCLTKYREPKLSCIFLKADAPVLVHRTRTLSKTMIYNFVIIRATW